MKYLLLLLLIPLLACIGYLWERHDYNKGICRKSGKPWIYFDTDSQGGRGYKDGEGHCVWVSYPFIERLS